MTAATVRYQSNRTLLAGIVATVVMLFTAFAAAYLERRGAAAEWQRVTMPQLLWLNTGLLLLSSFTIEIARRRGQATRTWANWIWATLVLGLCFLGGQFAAWTDLRAAGVFLPSHPHASFFYILTGLHGIHVVGGLIALFVAIRRRPLLNLCAGYWHLMGAVWLYVLFVLTVL